MIKGVIFDMDGVIADSLGVHNKAFIQLFRKYKLKLTKNDIKSTYGKSTKENLKNLKRKYNMKTPLNKLIKERDSILMGMIYKIKQIPGAVKLIKELSSLKKLAVASSSRRQIIKKILKNLKIEKFFSVVVSSEDVVKSKPNPDILLFTKRKLGLKKDELIVIEDSRNGIIAAKRAKIKCIAIPNKYTKNEDFSSADYITKSMIDAKRIISHIK
ncbi:HAD family phosphatase [Candidatus Woesearchaeota archaeon]|nr:HAD family phosphatase [Candidatus Woesearchaeota archaeon]